MKSFSEKIDKSFSTKTWEEVIIERGGDSLQDALNRPSVDELITRENKRRFNK